ncbi:MAG TPA: leucyl aminopeptidase [Flavobacteriales bacterium]|jgi:leucyl aminopeptidase|nr:leucyl aminopeptidase [Flavobacteriales bacterium]MBK6550239.1 leucyl aminopeptidase [Flavobacteriales bacterium]MBK7102913.1 leucyl aminopeptidase [Flavobacteriales bacterium]MBK7113482.1 leucyl aminopeptidase [Flavobacteriales bacterium]MBK8530843.1 leucyl aminopeptidase [Flavobacteriales bacterium]
MITLSKSTRTAASRDTLILLDSHSKLRNLDLERNDRQYLTEQLQADPQLAVCDVSGRLVMVHMISKAEPSVQMEKARRAGDAMAARLNTARRTEAQLISLQDSSAHTLALAEGVALGSYAFRKYKSDAKGAPTLEKLNIIAKEVATAEVDEMSDICEATWTARDLVNEPVSFLNAVQLGAEIRTLAKTTGFKVEVMELARIRALGLSGLLAVNKGSVDPPTFSVLEWKPKNAVNKKPILLVGKGVVYDTGGLSLKPTANSMDQMKCDMAGAAAVAGAISAIAKQELPVHVVGLIPATDNRPGGNAYAPGDVVRMHSGLTVEVLNTDAEGRMILADALSYGERFKPELVLSIATLTGAAMRAIGTYGTVVMGTAPDSDFRKLEEAGNAVFERTARLPFWEEYEEEIQSDVADIKNLGSDLGGAQTAGKFLARFTTHPYIHLDIAGPAFLGKRDGYRTKGGTGVGVRLFYEFIKRRAVAR